MITVKRIGPWLVSAAVHGALLAASIVTLTGVAKSAPARAPRMSEDASYSITLRPGGGVSIDSVARTEDLDFAAPASDATGFDEAPRDAFDDGNLLKPLEREFGRGRPSSSNAGVPVGSTSRSAGRTRLGSSGSGGGNPIAVGGARSGAGAGVGEGTDGGVEAVPLDTPSPAYPEEARREHLEGTVIVEIRIDRSGRVETARVTQGSGKSILDDAAVAAVRKWSYRPATLNGEAIASLRRVRLVFRLE